MWNLHFYRRCLSCSLCRSCHQLNKHWAYESTEVLFSDLNCESKLMFKFCFWHSRDLWCHIKTIAPWGAWRSGRRWWGGDAMQCVEDSVLLQEQLINTSHLSDKSIVCRGIDSRHASIQLVKWHYRSRRRRIGWLLSNSPSFKLNSAVIVTWQLLDVERRKFCSSGHDVFIVKSFTLLFQTQRRTSFLPIGLIDWLIDCRFYRAAEVTAMLSWRPQMLHLKLDIKKKMKKKKLIWSNWVKR